MAGFRMRVALALAILCSQASMVWSQNYADGMAAFRAGEFATALKQWRQLAIEGHAKAQYGLGLMYEYGRGVERNDVEASRWYRKSARQGVAAAQYRLAVLHENGWGIPRNGVAAARWYAKAAAQGHSFAQHDLAFMYFVGKGVPQDYVRAFMWLNIAVAQGNALMVKHLDLVAKNLTAAQIREARGLSRGRMRRRRQ